MRRRVVITGMGVLTPLGDSVDGLFHALIEGRSGVGPITHFDASTMPTRIAGEVKAFDLTRYVDDIQPYKDSGSNTQFAIAAAQMALADAGLLAGSKVDRSRFGIYLGTGEGRQDFHRLLPLIGRNYRPEQHAMDSTPFCAEGMKTYRPGREYEQELHTTPAHVARRFDLAGPNWNCLTACAASSQAIGEAVEIIRQGDADLMLGGGSHSMIHPLGVTGFNLLTALSTRNDEPQKASRPFDLHRDGFVLGEGAGMLVLEEYEHARKRGAAMFAEITGYGSTADAFRVTDSHPEGRGAIACMKDAMVDAGLTPADIGYINAHGTSTQINDRVETLAIKRVFGDLAPAVPISSTKSMTGHLIAAAGAVELVVCVLALRRGVLPPTTNYETPDPECDLDYIPNDAREVRARHALSNSFGFGGQNISLIVSLLRD